MTMAGHRYPIRGNNDRLTISGAGWRVISRLIAVIVVTSGRAGGTPQ
jgi:hypothetical protein